MSEDKEGDRLARLKTRAIIKRSSVIAIIRSVNSLALRASSEPQVIPEFLSAVLDLDTLWAQFKSEDESVLDYLIGMNKEDDYSPDLTAEVRALIHSSKAIATKLATTGVDMINRSKETGSVNSQSSDTHKPLSHLPEIPLPQFDGDFRYWPTFRDRFVALVDTRPNLSNIDKLHF